MSRLAVALALCAALVVLATWPRPQPPVPGFDAAHAETCRLLHQLGYSRARRLLAVAACRDTAPDRWISQYTNATCALLWQARVDSARHPTIRITK